MTKIAMKNWNPEGELTALLDGLAAELLAAPDQDVGAWAREARAKRHTAAKAVRRIVAKAADAGSEAPPVANFAVPGARMPFIRNQ